MTAADCVIRNSDSLSDPLAAPETRGSTAILEREEVKPQEPGDNERFAHYVRFEKMQKSAELGTPVVALCGKVWTPRRDPKKYPICPTCKEIHDRLMSPLGGFGSGQ